MKTVFPLVALMMLAAGCANSPSTEPWVIRGSVLNSEGDPEPGRAVSLEKFHRDWWCLLPFTCMGSYQPAVATLTDSTGHFELATYADGDYMLMIERTVDRCGAIEVLRRPLPRLNEFTIELSECDSR